MQDWIIGIINQYGYFGIALLIAVENIFPPIPSEVILTFSGFMTTVTDLKIWGVVLSATIGSVLGAVVLYSVGRLMSPQRLERLLGGKLGRVLHLKREDVHHAGAWFARRGKFTVFFCRFIPVVRSLISIPAGMAKMRMGMFLLLTALGTFLWNVVLVYLGAFFGASWETVVRYVDTYSLAAIAVVAVSLVVFCAWYFFRRSKRR
ncbi:MAG: DedA family protein [bacterium]